eukprot:TRINITY_DN14553_c0_g1_i1.p1 TRINITY_DN14553_c0_g1~~TRINITY_DN14553_c0_g1_i1.p1  ORF type:complete len:477 (-),score=52.83 TRINITY_DN14553_c0_g1_i1:48-1478(-)
MFRDCVDGILVCFVKKLRIRPNKPTTGRIHAKDNDIVWELSLDDFRQASEASGRRNRLNSKTFSLCAPSCHGSTPVRAYLTAQVNPQSGVFRKLVYGVKFVDEVSGAICSQSVGPRNPKMCVEHFAGDSRSCCAFPNIREHVDADSMFRLGFSFVLVDKPGSFPPMSDRFEMGEKCGRGSFGKVRQVRDKITGRDDLVMKVVKSPSDIALEVYALQKLAGCPGFVDLLGAFQHGEDKHALVTQRLHVDSSVFAKTGHNASRCSAKAVVHIGSQLVRCLQSVHKVGLLHNDIKPANVMIHSRGFQQVYLIDFGLATFFRWKGVHVSQVLHDGGDGVRVHGSPAFCSAEAHGGITSRRSDVENLCFVLMYLAAGSLLWCDPSYDRSAIRLLKRHRHVIALHMRSDASINSTLVDSLMKMWDHCQSLDFVSEPDYDWLVRNLESVMLSSSPSSKFVMHRKISVGSCSTSCSTPEIDMTP